MEWSSWGSCWVSWSLATPHLEVAARPLQRTERDNLVLSVAPCPIMIILPAQHCKHRPQRILGVSPAQLAHHQRRELLSRDGPVRHDLLHRSLCVAHSLPGTRRRLCAEAQGDHRERQLPAVDGAAAVGVEEVEYLPDLVLLRLGQGDMVLRSCVPDSGNLGPKGGVGVEALAEVPRNIYPVENHLRGRARQARSLLICGR